VYLSTMQIFHGDEHLRQARRPSILPTSRPRGLHAPMGERLSVLDAVDQGVLPSHMGEPVYLRLGYEIIGEIQVPDDGEVNGFCQRLCTGQRNALTEGMETLARFYINTRYKLFSRYRIDHYWLDVSE
jgi:hypothetical protein